MYVFWHCSSYNGHFEFKKYSHCYLCTGRIRTSFHQHCRIAWRMRCNKWTSGNPGLLLHTPYVPCRDQPVVNFSGLYCCPFQGLYCDADKFCCYSSIVVTRHTVTHFAFCSLTVILALWPTSSTLLSDFFLFVCLYCFYCLQLYR